MARLTKAHQEIQQAREKEKMEILKKKAEAQKNKVRYSEGWRNELTTEMLKETEFLVGSKEAPKLQDIADLYDYFDPILVYRDEEDEPFKLDYENFLAGEKKFEASIKKLNQELKDFNEGRNEKDKVEIVEEQYENSIEDDGEYTRAEKVSKKYLKRNNIIAKYFNRLVPLYNKYTCSCCGKNLPLSSFPVANSLMNAARMDINGSHHMPICKDCIQKLFIYYYTQECDKDLDKAAKYVCADLNIRWDKYVFDESRKKFEDNGRRTGLITTYINDINMQFVDSGFKDSPFLQEDYFENELNKIKKHKDFAPIDWTKEEAKNQRDIIHLLGYDPFQYEDNDEDKKILYADLISIMDEDIQQDYVKLQSALTIVKSFTKVRQIDEKMHQLENSDDPPLTAIKALSDLKAKELKAISDFSRDSGFSERFKTRQSQGQTSFTGIMKQMDEKQYEDELINKYDVQTSSTIQAAADASFKAIFNQLNLSDAEVYKIAADQLQELRKVKGENEKLKEQLRREKYKVSQFELREEAREKGLEVYDE